MGFQPGHSLDSDPWRYVAELRATADDTVRRIESWSPAYAGRVTEAVYVAAREMLGAEDVDVIGDVNTSALAADGPDVLWFVPKGALDDEGADPDAVVVKFYPLGWYIVGGPERRYIEGPFETHADVTEYIAAEVGADDARPLYCADETGVKRILFGGLD
jgi:hypothetical protein